MPVDYTKNHIFTFYILQSFTLEKHLIHSTPTTNIPSGSCAKHPIYYKC